MMLPRIWLGFWSRMRLSAAAETEGCWNWTLWLLATLKLFQLTTRLLDCWLMRVVLTFGVLIAPWPATTTPPCGFAKTGAAEAASTRPAAARLSPQRRRGFPSSLAPIGDLLIASMVVSPASIYSYIGGLSPARRPS